MSNCGGGLCLGPDESCTKELAEMAESVFELVVNVGLVVAGDEEAIYEALKAAGDTGVAYYKPICDKP